MAGLRWETVAPAHEPTANDLAIDLTTFVAAGAMAVAFSWDATDLIWSLWLSSLLIGYSFIVVAAIRSTVNRNSQHEAMFEKMPPLWADLARVVGAVYLVCFFTVHFGMFHLVHSVFLNGFFPLDGTTDAVHRGLFSHLDIAALAGYLPFVLASAVSERHTFIDHSHKAEFMRPYVNVVKMHLLIFFFAFVQIGGVGHTLVYLVVLFVYFFPLRGVVAALKNRNER